MYCVAKEDNYVSVAEGDVDVVPVGVAERDANVVHVGVAARAFDVVHVGVAEGDVDVVHVGEVEGGVDVVHVGVAAGDADVVHVGVLCARRRPHQRGHVRRVDDGPRALLRPGRGVQARHGQPEQRLRDDGARLPPADGALGLRGRGLERRDGHVRRAPDGGRRVLGRRRRLA